MLLLNWVFRELVGPSYPYSKVLGQVGADGIGHHIHLPPGYALFSHYKPQAEGKIREDVYLFGSKHTAKVGPDV